MNLKRLFFIMTVSLLTTLALPVLAQTRTVTGKVTDSSGNALPNATVAVKGTNFITQTAADGTFKLENVPANAKTLTISYVGYTTQEVVIGTGAIPVHLAIFGTVQADVIVQVGYGTARKKDVTGAVTTITEKDFNKGEITTPEQLIQGKVAGVEITPSSGQPGAGSTIRIRNGASLNASNDPLIVIDGVPIDNGKLNGAANPLDMINPNDIESFTVLKDASATAIYGSRASNGVIIIVTKKGKRDKEIHLNFSTLLSEQYITKFTPVLDTAQFRNAIKQYNPTYLPLLGNSNTDWQKQIYQNAFATDNNLSINGGIKWLPYRASLGFTDDNGILKTGYMERESGDLNLSPSFFNNTLKVNANIRGAITQNRFANTAAIGAATSMDPTQSVYSGNSALDGYWEWTGSGGAPLTLAPKNPLGLLEQTFDKSTVKRSIGNLQLDYAFPFLTGLRANVNGGYDVSRSNGSYFQDSSGASGHFSGGDTRTYTQKITNKVLDFYLYYTKDLKSINSHIDATAGYSYQDVLRESPASPDSNLAKTTQLSSPLPDSTDLTLISFWGRVNYNYAGKYLLTATLRDDGSSRFNPNNRWGLFPSVALAWNLKEEKFLSGAKTFSALKLRLGYGITGNQDIGQYYPYQASYSLGTSTAQYGFGNTYYSIFKPNAYDAGIKWEQQTTYNLGVDFGFLNNRLNGSIDVYDKKTSNLLSTVFIPQGTNFSNEITSNVGDMENKGIEFSVNAQAIKHKDFAWNLNFNITYSTSKITNLSLSAADTLGTSNIPHGGIGGGGTGTNVQVYQVGYDPNQFYLYRQVYGANGAPLEGVYADLKGSGAPTLDYYKTATPKVFLGFSSDFTYLKWDLGFTLRAELGNYVYNNVAANGYYNSMANSQGFVANTSAAVLTDNFLGAQYLSNYFLENGSFLKMDNIHLGYDFGKVIDKKVSVRASITVQNVFTITKYTGLDPEVYGGIDNNIYPHPHVVSLGVGLGF